MLLLGACSGLEQEDLSQKHIVIFRAACIDAPATKTTVDEGSTSAMFYWEDADEERFTIWENGREADDYTMVFSDNYRTAGILAEFPNSHDTSFEYTAIVSGTRSGSSPAVPAAQESSSDAYDPDADILVADPVKSDIDLNLEELSMHFKRPVAISRMTLKGFASGEKVTSVELTADKYLTGTYDMSDGTFASGGKSLTLSCSETASSKGEVELLFVSVPASKVNIDIKVTTDRDVYTKSFAKAITIAADALTRFTVNLEGTGAGPDPHADDQGWFLVYDTAYLQSGDIIRIAEAGRGYVASGWADSYLTASSDVTFSSDYEQMTSAPKAMDITITEVDGCWELESDYGVICGKTAKRVTLDDSSALLQTWPISINSSGDAIIGNASLAAPGRFLFNTNAPRFQIYTDAASSSMKLPQIYKCYGTYVPEKEKTKLSMGAVTCTEAGTTFLRFEWSEVTNAVGYAVSFDGGSEVTITSTTWLAKDLAEGTTHTISVRALAGESKLYSDSDRVTCTARTTTTQPENPLGGWFELPTMYDANGDGRDDYDSSLYYASHTFSYGGKEYRNYSVCFDADAHCAAWVAAPMHSFYSTKNTTRKDNYKVDPSIPSSIQYTQSSNGSGGVFNRGHLLGSADRLVCEEANKQVFYYSNIAPQYGNTFNLGGGAWNNLEGDIDGYVCADTLYAVIGVYFEDFKAPNGATCKAEKVTFMGRDDVSKPTMFYYAVLRTKSGKSGKSVAECSASELQCAAFVLSHDTAKGHKIDRNDIWTINELEALTGFTYFSNVPNAPKGTVNYSDWGK